MDKKNNAQYVIDELASQAGGYFSMPTQEDIAYTDLLFDVCRQFGIRYYSASAKEKAFVEEVTRVTWAKQQETATGIKQNIPAPRSRRNIQGLLQNLKYQNKKTGRSEMLSDLPVL